MGQEIEGDESSNSLNISSSASSTASSSCVSPDQFQRHPDPIPDSVKKEIPPITKQVRAEFKCVYTVHYPLWYVMCREILHVVG